ncbi:nucleoporin p58/p45-like isoform X3 [Rhodnius prolixus]|uniref:nucleoporin p58/p45-like isoform X3 n=1 Tax=Rhodnius prolixus TaxID=13249 RepID=UPI003D18CF5B
MSTQLNFGTGTGTLFGNTPTTSASTFGSTGGQTPFTMPVPTTTQPTTAVPQFSFGQAVTTTTVAPSFSFSASTTPQTQATAGISFGTPAQTATSQPTTSAPVMTSFGTLQNLSKSSDLNALNAKPVSPKDQPVHPDLGQLMDILKKHIDEQKKIQLELSRASISRLALKVSDDADLLKRELMKIESVLTKNKGMNQKLKDETIKMVADCEIMQRMVEVPRGSPPDLSAAREYFADLVARFDSQVVCLRNELDNAQRHVNSQIRATSFTPQDLSLSMQRLYECFVALAGRYQSIHSNVAALKARHLELRRQQLNDFTDIFQCKRQVKNKAQEIAPEKGPTPFVGHRNYHTVSMIASRSKQASSFLPHLQHESLTAGLAISPGSFIVASPTPIPPSLSLSTQQHTFSSKQTPGGKRGKR